MNEEEYKDEKVKDWSKTFNQAAAMPIIEEEDTPTPIRIVDEHAFTPWTGERYVEKDGTLRELNKLNEIGALKPFIGDLVIPPIKDNTIKEDNPLSDAPFAKQLLQAAKITQETHASRDAVFQNIVTTSKDPELAAEMAIKAVPLPKTDELEHSVDWLADRELDKGNYGKYAWTMLEGNKESIAITAASAFAFGAANAGIGLRSLAPKVAKDLLLSKFGQYSIAAPVAMETLWSLPAAKIDRRLYDSPLTAIGLHLVAGGVIFPELAQWGLRKTSWDAIKASKKAILPKLVERKATEFYAKISADSYVASPQVIKKVMGTSNFKAAQARYAEEFGEDIREAAKIITPEKISDDVKEFITTLVAKNTTPRAYDDIKVVEAGRLGIADQLSKTNKDASNYKALSLKLAEHDKKLAQLKATPRFWGRYNKAIQDTAVALIDFKSLDAVGKKKVTDLMVGRVKAAEVNLKSLESTMGDFTDAFLGTVNPAKAMELQTKIANTHPEIIAARDEVKEALEVLAKKSVEAVEPVTRSASMVHADYKAVMKAKAKTPAQDAFKKSLQEAANKGAKAHEIDALLTKYHSLGVE